MMAKQIEQKLNDAFTINSLNIIDDPQKHQGHAGWKEGGESHFRVEIVSPDFAGKTRVERHKMVYGALEAELKEQIHALALKTATPNE